MPIIPAGVACTLGIVGGVLHGASMAVRKYFGEGDKEYMRNPRWWIGVALDSIGGGLFFSASPFLAAGILFTLAIVAQMCTGCALGVFCFHEEASLLGKIGVACMFCGCMALAFCEHGDAGMMSTTEFFEGLCSSDFLLANVAWLALVAGLYAWSSLRNWDQQSTALAHSLAAAYADGLQFLPTRYLASVLFVSHDWTLFVVLALALKCSCLYFYIQLQQLALETRLHVIGSLSVTLAATMYKDRVEMTAATFTALIASAAGIVLNVLPAAAAEHHDENIACASVDSSNSKVQ